MFDSHPARQPDEPPEAAPWRPPPGAWPAAWEPWPAAWEPCPDLVDPDPGAADAWPVDPADREPFESELPDVGSARKASLVRRLGDDRALAEVFSAAPSAGTALALQGVRPEELGDVAALEYAAAWRRVSAWAAARSARAAAVLADRPSMNPPWPDAAGRVSEPCIAGVELAMRMGVSRRAGEDLVRLGRAIEGPLWPTGEALARGELDERKAQVLVRALAESPVQVAIAVQDAVLPVASQRTPAQLTADVERALVEADPEGADRRFLRARRGRHVGRPRALPDGMAGMWAVLPSASAVALDRTLDAVARRAHADGDARTVGQLRADALTAAVLGDEELRRRLRTPAGRPIQKGTRDAGPGADHGADHGEPHDGKQESAPFAEDHDLVPTLQDLDRLLAERVRVDVRVVVPADNLLGEEEVAAYLSGVGAIPPLAARALAAGGIWRRLVTDPYDGAALDLGRTRYRPTAALAEHLVERDATCVRPGCSTPADRCDLDHRVPWDDLGTTSADNMAPLCRPDHLLKTHAGHRLTRGPDGAVVWRTPIGQEHRRQPHLPGTPTVRRLPDEDDDIPF